ncbi:unnamed protein product [Caenorhabditis auriculariae]|uniref:Band 7 domain-containing protein n=1 Tax=Caenorhabditis auriculariae TaxID=2777116 RepID=A0A8S1HU46_9PELO|nr:unnamed protein product [Caenorhabditis auriculariae]
MLSTTHLTSPEHQNDIREATTRRIRRQTMADDYCCCDAWRPTIFIFSIFISLMIILFLCTHQVQEGNVAVYYRGGVLLDTVNGPGFHYKLPFVTSFKIVKVVPREFLISDVRCGTSSGIVLVFEMIKVISQLQINAVHEIVKHYSVNYEKLLIDEKIRLQINHFCSNRTVHEVYVDDFGRIGEILRNILNGDLLPNIEIMGVRVEKPTIPRLIRDNYEQMEIEKTRVSIALEHRKAVETEAETKKNKAIIEAETVAKVATIQNRIEIDQKKKEWEMKKFEAAKVEEKQRAAADLTYYLVQKEAMGNKKLLTP